MAEQRAINIDVAPEGEKSAISMAALKQSMQAKGQANVRDAVRRRMDKPSEEEKPRPRASRLRPALILLLVCQLVSAFWPNSHTDKDTTSARR